MTRQDTEPAIRLRRAPHSDPPYDDEREPDAWPSPHQLAFDLARLLPAGTTTRRPPARTAPAGPVAPARPATSGHQPSTGVSPDARLAVRRFIGLCVEVLNGYRPAAHLRKLAQPREAAAVVAQGVTAAHRVAEARRTTDPRRATASRGSAEAGRATELRRGPQLRPAAEPRGASEAGRAADARRAAERHPRSRRPAPAAVVKVSLCEPRPGAVEAAAVLVIGDRAWALALRLELHDDAWLATVLRLI